MGWMDDFERMRRQFERLSRDLAPSLEMLRQFERQHDWAKLQRDIMPATMAAQEHFETLRRFAEPKYFADLSALVARNQLDLSKLLAFNLSAYRAQNSAGLDALQSLKTIAGSAALSSAATEFIGRVNATSDLPTKDSGSGSDAIEEAYLQEATRLQLTPATAQWVLSILLTLLLYWLAQQSAAESEDRILGRIGQLESAIEEAVAALAVGSNQTEVVLTTRAVSRSTVVLTRPSGRSGRALGLVYADQVVMIRSGRGKWCEIEWFDLRDRSQKLGWVRKKYLGPVRK